MNYSINKDDNKPAYLQLYYILRESIIAGDYEYGDKIPSKRTIAADAELSLVTVEHALLMLCDEGYLESRERSGLFCIYRDSDFQGTPINIKDDFAFIQEERIIESVGSDFTFPFSVLAKVMRRVLSDYGERILEKSPNNGHAFLREEICLYLARSRGIHVKENQIIIGSGAEYLYGLIAQFFGSDHIFALEEPSYGKIRKVYESYGITCRGFDVSAEGIDVDSLERSDADIFHVTPFDSYPSGANATVTKKREYLSWAGRNGGFIIEDNYASELTVSKKMEDTLYSMTRNGNVIYVNTFSKTIAPSLRAGYMILPENLIEDFNRKLGFYACPVPVFEQLVIGQLLAGGDYERHINRVRRRKRREEK